MRLTLPFVIAGVALAAAPVGAQEPDPGIALREVVRAATVRAYQGRNAGPEQTERFSRKVRVGRDGRVSISNISGDITVTAGSGDEASIEAVKKTRGDRDELGRVQIVVEDHAGHVDVHTDHTGRNDRVSVDYTVTVPPGASLELASVSGSIKVSGVKGSVRATSVSGSVTTTDTPKLESAKSTSGNISIGGISGDGDLNAGSVSGNVTVRGVKARGVELGSVSGDVVVSDAACDRFSAKSVSGSLEYAGAVSKGGVYEMNSHSGAIRLTLSNPAGFYLNANSFSGSIRTDLPITIGGDTNRGDSSRRRGINQHEIRGVTATAARR